nr:glutaminyl-peptide cyclotransferase [Pseudomonas sp. PB106]
MDSLINAAGRALAGGDPLAALKLVALREDPPALALRGKLTPTVLPPVLRAVHELMAAGLALRRVQAHTAQITLTRAQQAAELADIPSLSAEIEHACTLQSNRFVTGVTWVDGALWHGTCEGDESELRRIDPQDGEVLGSPKMPDGISVSGLEADGGERFYCGGRR